mgnify:FL=1
MVPEYRNATSANTEPVAAKSYTMGHRPRVGASAAPNCGQAERRNWGLRLERTIPLHGRFAAAGRVDDTEDRHIVNKTFYLSYPFSPVSRTNRYDLMQADVH